ncbi:MAG: LacI family DNA-binding transcriptional regulator [Planctomycetota bacterium]
MAVTAADIAQKLGVSRQSVSKVLVGGKSNVRVSESLATRVRAVADELGYRPDTAARMISTGRRGSIDLLMSTEAGASVLYSGVIRGIQDGLIEHDVQLTVSRLPDTKLTDADYVPKILREQSADGILVNYTHLVPPDLPALLKKHRIPAIWLNTKRDARCVYPDEVDAFARGTQHLIDLGHKRIAFYLTSEHGHFSEADRRQGYEHAMHQAGLTPQVQFAGAAPRFVCDANPLEDDRLARALAWLKSPDRPTAVVAYAQIDTTLLAYAAAQLGLELGKDLSLVGVSEDEGVNHLGAPLTQLVTPRRQVGRSGVEMLLRQIEEPDRRDSSLAVEVPLMIGHSTASPTGVA